MPKSTKPTANPKASKGAPKAASKNTDSAPSKVRTSAAPDVAEVKATQTEQLAAAMPFNPTKPGEHGFANGVMPKPGVTVEPASFVRS